MSRLFRTSRLLAWLFLLGLSVTILIGSGFYLYLRPGLPAVEQLMDIRLQTPLRVYSADDKLIAEFGEKRRAPVTIEQIPTIQLHAFLAAEDARFYEHFGVDIRGLVRAAVELISTGQIRSGGSTITMQVAKNYFLSRDRTFIRKFNEILLALQIERELEKDQILELYLNKIYLGNRAYGLAAAAQVYYNKPVSELSLAQMAMLAGLPKAPSAYNPLADPERAKARRNWILGRMRDLGYITRDAWELAASAPITADYHVVSSELEAGHVAEMARSEMIKRFGDDAYNDGYSVTVTIDSTKQRAAVDALQAGLEAYDRRHGFRGPIGTVEEEQLVPGNLKNLMANYRSVGSLAPAVVTGVDDNAGLTTLYARGIGPVEMPFETMQWARRHKTESLTGPRPEKPSDVLATGNVVYVKPMAHEPATGTDERPEGEKGNGEQVISALPQVSLAQLPDVQGALVSLNARNGAVEALTGGYSFSYNKYNRATQALRQPGSTFKPFLYLSALEKGLTPATIFNDAPIVFDDKELETVWRPQNSSGQFYGPTRLREALYSSRNLVSIRLLRDLGVPYVLDYLEQLHIPIEHMQKDLSLALGSGQLTPMQLARGFAVIANGGHDVTPYLIETIRNAAGEIIYQAPEVVFCESEEDCTKKAEEKTAGEAALPADNEAPQQTFQRGVRYAERLADKRSVYILHSMLQDVIRRGTGRRALALGRPDIAGKTGTTNNQRDAWFVGFNLRIATAAWVGFDDSSPLGRGEYGARAALPIWLDYMKVALSGTSPATMPRPNGIVSVRIDPETGKRASADQEDAVFELFPEELAPPALENKEGSGSGNGGSVPQGIF
ncbi:penicillin-binding protein 1A [Marinobacter sp.]|jgi:penicillin-binding protein 1A|uniref:penicillin-binding protein 1A n=1 Tax=Marinobacter sp. TaxID=50741 RepID=UPI001994A558|nr:penicillin-binding protein 1A [Marinobacter sp.]MBC7193070.1 penicillin-binding protein 1A [Marinobacter sp.]